MNIYFIRHGESQGKVDTGFYGKVEEIRLAQDHNCTAYWKRWGLLRL